MKFVRTLSLGLALSVCSPLVAVLPAGAATAGQGVVQPKWGVTGDFVPQNKPVNVPATKSVVLMQESVGAVPGATPMVQLLSRGAWVDVMKAQPVSANKFTVTVGKGSTQKLSGTPGQQMIVRLQWKATNGTKDWATNSKTVLFAKNAPQVSAKYPYGASAKFTVGSKSQSKYSLTMNREAKYLRVERYDTAKRAWVTSRNMTTTGVKQGKAQFTMPLPKFDSGSTHKFRLKVPAQTGVNEWTGATQTLSWPKTSSQLSSSVFNGLTLVSSTGGQEAEAFVSGSIGRSVLLQQYSKNKWVTKSSMKTSKTGVVKVKLPKLSHGTKARLRLHAPASAKNFAVTGKTVTVKYQDPRRVTGLAKEVRDLMKSKCPTATVTLVSHAKSKGWAASANGRENRINVYAKMNRNRSDWKPFIKYIAQHECAHILTYQAAKKVGANSQSDLNKLFGTKGNDGVERVADAVATHWSGNTRNNFYKKSFTQKQRYAAGRIFSGRWF